MRVQVKQRHIDEAASEDRFNCTYNPIGRAILEMIDSGEIPPNVHVQAVPLRLSLLRFNDGALHAEMPEEATEFLMDFRAGRDLQPFEFEVQFEESVVRE